MYKPYPASTKPLYVYNQKYDNKKKPEKETYRFHGAFVAPQGQKKRSIPNFSMKMTTPSLT